MVDTIPHLEDARAAFLRKAARDNLLWRRLLPFGNLYEVEEEEIVPCTLAQSGRCYAATINKTSGQIHH